MKYDDCKITESVNFPNQNKKINALDIFIVQALICVGISCGVMISKIIEIGF